MMGRLLLIFATICLCTCKSPPAKENDSSRIKPDSEIEEGFTALNLEEYLSGHLLIGKKSSLKGLTALHIKGDRSYEFDERGNILAVYDISNNYTVYSYDDKDRLVKFEIKQHTPAETYHEVLYTYSGTDSVIEIQKSSITDGEMRLSEAVKEHISLDAERVKELYFLKEKDHEFYIHEEKGEILTYEEDMIFCCGVLMKGQNKLTYFIKQNGRIDSLIIRSMEEDNEMKFEYEYD
ncbi:MAG: RHS repeat domain-containing protein [Bacteroidia bacterium]|nr:RHS repeat domain-containing protein [Bacteroidia bacterium]